MIIAYLEKLYQEMYEQKVFIEHDYNNNELLLKQNMQFIYTLEDSLDKNYESFSPRNINHETYKKIERLRDEQSNITKVSEELKKKMCCIEEHIAELESILKIIREKKKIQLNNEGVIEEEEVFRKKILETQEMERQRIARELHDSIVQSLTSIVHKIEFCTKLMDMDTIRCELELQTMSKMVKKIIEDMRQVIYDLRPMSLDDIGLSITLQHEIDKLQNMGKVLIDYNTKGTIIDLPPLTSLTILRIVQEACNNTVKHAGATQMKIQVLYETNKIELKVEDNGCGFDVNSIKHLPRSNGSGFGISMMKERVYLLSGKINIKSVVGEGTIIRVEIPTSKEEN